MELLVYLFVIFFITTLTIIIYEGFFSKRKNVKYRLESIGESLGNPSEDNRLRLPFTHRIIRPAYGRLVGFIGRATPYEIGEEIERIILNAGSSGNMTVSRLLAIQFMVGLILPASFYLLAGLLGNKIKLITLGLLGILGFLIPLYVLKSKARARQIKIQRNLPDMLDLLYISVEAGLGFDMALKRTGEKMPGPLAEEINRALDEINRGRGREEALRAIVHRSGVDDLSTFISAVIQSEQLGSNIANMLRIQSTSMRQKRRQRAEELAMKIPIKMLFPLIFFMFPALFIVILGPAVIRIIEVFKDMF